MGTSAGGARAKAIVAWNRDTNEVRSGQVKAPEGFDYWLLKFDGVSANRDKELEDPKGYTVIEYAYALMAADACIEMSECRLLEEGGRRHFMTRRFDRLSDGGKLHMQSLAALAHFDFNSARGYSYEQAFDVIKRQTTEFLAGRLGSPGYKAERALLVSLLPARDPALREATPDTVSALTLDDVKGYRAATFRPDLTTIVAKGKNKMPAYEKTLKADEIKGLVAYVRGLAAKK